MPQECVFICAIFAEAVVKDIFERMCENVTTENEYKENKALIRSGANE